MTRKKSTGENLPLNMMTKGTVMYKVRSASKWYKRKYKVDIDNLKLSYSPSTKHFWTSTIARASKCIPVPPEDSSIVSIRYLIEVRKGWNTDVFQKLQTRFRRNFQRALHPTLISMLKEENCFSLVIAPDRTIASGSKLDNTYVVDLIAPSMEVRDAWVRGLNQLIVCSKIEDAEQRWLIDRIREADVNGNGSLNFEECLGLLKQLNIGMRRSEARKLFDRVKPDGQDALGPEEFIRLYRILNHRPELEEIMKKYSASRSVLWDAEELKTFLCEEQHDSLSIEDCKDMIEEYEPEETKNSGFLSLEGFQKLLTIGQEDIFNKRHRTVYQDMTQPLTRYYIATSHNTYLIQDQLLGESSIEGYVQALKRGCRCLELDTWDGPDEEPIIFHGYTLTSRILLKDVLEAIKKYAFSVSQYPIILSIENHCSVPYQEKMAYYFRTILGEYLYTDCIGEDEKEHPSPESLSKKIFIKGKKLKDELMMSEECHFMLEEEEEREADLANALASAPTPPGEGDEIIPTLMAASSQRKRIAKELSDLVNYFSAKRFSSFEECKNSWEFNEMTSLSETVALNLGCTQGLDFVKYNKKHFSRIYPKGTRTDSSNFDPFPFWNLGCQMVALNYQTWDKYVYLNEAKFAQNGRCGYLLKPEYLTSDKTSYDPNKPPYAKRQIKVTIKVVSAQYLPKPPCASETDVVDPYVSIKVVGHPADQTKKRTSFVSNNGFNPVWNETFNFVVNAPEQAIFYFCVKDQNITSNALIGQFALPCSSINEGYRHVYLEDCRGQKLEKATLFVHVQMSESEQE